MATQRRFVIREKGGKERELWLLGRVMPFSPVPIGEIVTEMSKSTVTGNPVASVQIYGFSMEPFTVHGQIRTKHLATTGKAYFDYVPILNVAEFVEALRELQMGGQLLEVVWGDTYCQGYIKRTGPFSYYTRDHADWSFEFDPTSRFAEVQPPWIEAQEEAAGLLDTVQDFAKKATQIVIEAFEYAFQELEFIEDETRGLQDTLRLVEALASSALDLVVYGKDVADEVLGLAYQGYRLAMNVANQGRAIAMIDTSSYMAWTFGTGSRHFVPPVEPPQGVGSNVGVSDNPFLGGEGGNEPGAIPLGWHLPENCGSTMTPLAFNESGSTPLVLNSMNEHLDRMESQRVAVSQAQALALKYKSLYDALSELSDPGAPRTVYLKQDEDLRRVALREYGDFAKWRDIASFNYLNGSTAPAGTKLVLP